MIKLGERLKKMRKEYGLTQKQLGKMVCIEQTNISTIERSGDWYNPTLNIIRRMYAAFLKVRPDMTVMEFFIELGVIEYMLETERGDTNVED